MHTRQWLCKNILWKASHVEQSMFLKTCHISVKVTLFLSHTRDFHFLRQSFSVIASLIPAYAFNNNTILDCYIFFAWNHMVKFYLLIIFVCVPVKPFFRDYVIGWLDALQCYWNYCFKVIVAAPLLLRLASGHEINKRKNNKILLKKLEKHFLL